MSRFKIKRENDSLDLFWIKEFLDCFFQKKSMELRTALVEEVIKEDNNNFVTTRDFFIVTARVY
jgi:hypothetical protein